MGGCVSTPKDFAVNEGEAPVEVPTSPKKADGETVAQENTQEVVKKKDEPLVNSSEPEEKAVESNPGEAATVTAEAEKKELAPVEEPKADETNKNLVTL